MAVLLYYFLTAVFLSFCKCLKVLVVFTIPVQSHRILGNGYVRHLLEADYEVTYITPYPTLDPHQNLRQIDVSSTSRFIGGFPTIESLMTKDENFEDMHIILDLMTGISRRTMGNINVQKLLNDPEEKFDLVIAEWLLTEMYAGFSAVFNCPLIWSTSTHFHWMILRLGETTGNPAYFPSSHSSNIVPFSHTQQLQELWIRMKDLVMKNGEFYERESGTFEKYVVPILKKQKKIVPAYSDIIWNASLIIANSHPLLTEGIPLPPNFISIGGYHIDSEVKPLPDKLQKIMDEAEHGVIYFSMGSNLDLKGFPLKIKHGLIEMFREMKNTVIVKCEKTLPNLPKNVHVVPWAPQQSILAHPNCILFITHGGFLSTTESLYFGVPIIGIPVYGDQFYNIANAERRRFGKLVPLTFNLTENLKVAIDEVIGDIRYKTRMTELMKVYHDMPVSPGKKLDHWLRYVVRTHGASNLRCPSFFVPWYEQIYLDLVVYAVVLFVTLRILVSVFLKRVKLVLKKNS